MIIWVGVKDKKYESYLNLRLRHAEGVRQFGPFRPRKVFCLFKGLLEREDLLPAEGGSRVLLLPVLIHAPLGCACAQRTVAHCNIEI